MTKLQAALLIMAFFLLPACCLAADARSKEQLQSEYKQISTEFQLIKAQQENLAYRERDLVGKAKEIQEALKKLEPKKDEKKEVKK